MKLYESYMEKNNENCIKLYENYMKIYEHYMKLYENYMKKFKRDAKLVMMGLYDDWNYFDGFKF